MYPGYSGPYLHHIKSSLNQQFSNIYSRRIDNLRESLRDLKANSRFKQLKNSVEATKRMIIFVMIPQEKNQSRKHKQLRAAFTKMEELMKEITINVNGTPHSLWHINEYLNISSEENSNRNSFHSELIMNSNVGT